MLKFSTFFDENKLTSKNTIVIININTNILCIIFNFIILIINIIIYNIIILFDKIYLIINFFNFTIDEQK